MTEVSKNEKIVWTPLMPDRRKDNRRNNGSNLHTNGKMVNISNMKEFDDRRANKDRRKKVTLTITGRAIDVE